jgi:hypothetical protein
LELTSAEIVERVAASLEPAGRTASHTDRVMRSLKNSNDPTVMPKSKQGGGTGMVYPQPSHFSNFALGVMATNTATEAALAVQIYRPLEALLMTEETVTVRDGDVVITRTTCVRGLTEITDVDGKRLYPWDEGNNFMTFGDIIEAIILGHDTLEQVHECRVWHAEPWAEITVRISPNKRHIYSFAPVWDLFDAADPRPLRQPPSGSSFTMPVETFRVLGELARHSTDRQKIVSNAATGKAA